MISGKVIVIKTHNNKKSNNYFNLYLIYTDINNNIAEYIIQNIATRRGVKYNISALNQL